MKGFKRAYIGNLDHYPVVEVSAMREGISSGEGGVQGRVRREPQSQPKRYGIQRVHPFSNPKP